MEEQVRIIPMVNEPRDNSRIDVAADRLAVFLDVVAIDASDGRSFLMDDTYSAMLGKREEELKLKTQLLPSAP